MHRLKYAIQLVPLTGVPGKAFARRLALLLLVFSASMSIADDDIVINEIVVFGASYSDTGNVFLATGNAIPPSPPYFLGRFSNGPLWHEIVAAGLGVSAPQPDIVGGSNYAWGGAETGEGLGELGVPNLGLQIDTYLSQASPGADKLYLVVGGGNDIIPPGEPKSAREIVDNLAAHVTELAEAGARQFVVPNLPTIENFPLTNSLDAATVSELQRTARRTNWLLRWKMRVLERRLNRSGMDVAIVYVDWNLFFRVVIAFPGLIGVENTTDTAINPPDCPPCTGVLAPNPNDFFWIDFVHPTAPVHEALGIFALRKIQRKLLRD